MSISTYAELQTAIANWTHRTDLASIIPDLIGIAENRIFREVRVRVMETAFDETIANGLIAVPADYLEFKFLYINDAQGGAVRGATASQIYSKYPNRTNYDRPQYIGREGANFIFGPNASAAYNIKGIYYAKLTGIATTANALFLENSDLYLFATLAEAAPYCVDDPRAGTWEAKYDSIKQQMSFADSGEASGGGMMTIRAA